MLSISPCKWISLAPKAKSLKPWHFLLAAAAPAEQSGNGRQGILLTPISVGSGWDGSIPMAQFTLQTCGSCCRQTEEKSPIVQGGGTGWIWVIQWFVCNLEYSAILWWDLYGMEGRDVARTAVTGGPQRGPGAHSGGGITIKDSLSWRRRE